MIRISVMSSPMRPMRFLLSGLGAMRGGMRRSPMATISRRRLHPQPRSGPRHHSLVTGLPREARYARLTDYSSCDRITQA